MQIFGNALEKLFGIFLNSKSDLRSATGFSEAAIQNLFNKLYDQFYAYEICPLAIAFRLIPITLFHSARLLYYTALHKLTLQH
ncbi:hypothetical protein OKW96_05560 [Sphingobacterium sp. KU25419]|nr:hypothetical protein OKW96_05560 [Sphingobacterium sp. KU25419]